MNRDELAVEIFQRGGVTLHEAMAIAKKEMPAKRGPKLSEARIERNQKIIDEYLSSPVTTSDIGKRYGISHTRVQQVLEAAGISRKDGALSKAVHKRRNAKKPFRYAKRSGVTNEVWRRACDEGLTRRWLAFCRNCKKRGIEVQMTADDFYRLWWCADIQIESRPKYCVSRIDPDLPYTKENTCIEPLVALSSRTMKKTMSAETHKNADGVFLMYPNYKKPWMAKAGRRFIGYYETRDEALQARQMAMESAQ